MRLVCHERVREELTELFPTEAGRLHFVPDRWTQVALWRLGQRLPDRVAARTVGVATHLITQASQRAYVKRLVREHAIDVVHEPIPVSPTQPSLTFGVGAPVVIGPMNGGIRFPPAFRSMQGWWRLPPAAGRVLSTMANLALPGKRRAAVLLVANSRTREALPNVVRRVRIIELTENGVDLTRWQPRPVAVREDHTVRFAFVGRLISLKAVDILLDAFESVVRAVGAQLEIFGDGPVRGALEAQAAALGLGAHVKFHGFVPQSEVAIRLASLDALVLPSLCECGGAVVLEAMALGLPVVATNWGGPADYVDDSCGILASPDSRESFRRQLSEAMLKLATSAEYREQLGRAAHRRISEHFDWERKVDRILEIYELALREA